MKKLVMSAALGASAMLLSACGERADDSDTAMAEGDTAAATSDTAPAPAPTETVTTAAADWPAGTRIVEENGTFYRVDPAGSRIVIAPDTWRIETVDGVRYRVDRAGTRIRIDESGLDVDVDLDPDG